MLFEPVTWGSELCELLDISALAIVILDPFSRSMSMHNAAAFSPYGTSGVDRYKTASAEDGHANPPGRMVLQNEIWEKGDNCLRIDLRPSQIEVHWIQLYATSIAKLRKRIRQLNSGPVTVMVYGFVPPWNYRVTWDTCLSSHSATVQFRGGPPKAVRIEQDGGRGATLKAIDGGFRGMGATHS